MIVTMIDVLLHHSLAEMRLLLATVMMVRTSLGTDCISGKMEVTGDGAVRDMVPSPHTDGREKID